MQKDMVAWFGRQLFSGRWKSKAAQDYLIKKWVSSLKAKARPVKRYTSFNPNIAASVNHYDPYKHTAFYNDELAASVGL